MGTENLSVVRASLYSLYFTPSGKIKCLNFLSWWWWEYCMRCLKNTCSFFGSTYVKSSRQVICSRNSKIGQCLGNMFSVNWMSGCLVLLALSMSEMSWKESEDPERQGQISSLHQFDCDCIDVLAFLSGITNYHFLLEILHPDLKWLHLAPQDDRFLRKYWVYVCGGQYCSSPTILTVWSTSGKTFSFVPSGQFSPVSAALNNVVFVRAVALCAGITACVWCLHVPCLSRNLVACHSLCSCSTLKADFEGLQ